MHGTQLNDVKLLLDTPQAVKNGDIVSFGAEVRRGPDTFPPCRFHIEYELVPWAYVHQSSLTKIKEFD